MDIGSVRKENKHILWAAGLLFLLLFLISPVKVNAGVTENDVYAQYMYNYGRNYSGELVYVRKYDHETLYFQFTASGKSPDIKKYKQVYPNAVYNHIPAGSYYDSDYNNLYSEYFVIDLSALNTSKANDLYICYDLSETPYKLEIPAAKKLKVEYRGKESKAGEFAAMYEHVGGMDLETGYLVFTIDDVVVENINTTFRVNGVVMFRAGTGMNFRRTFDLDWDLYWKSQEEHDGYDIEWYWESGGKLNSFNIEMYQNSGATLYFTYSDFNTPCSKLAKLKLKKPAAAPTIKVDGSKQTIGIKSNMQYRVKTGNVWEDWTDAPEDRSYLRLSEIEGLSGDGIYYPFEEATIEVRVAATEKKHSSLPATIHLDTVSEPVFGSTGITMTYKNGRDDTDGLVLKNNSDEVYQVAIVEKYSWETEGIKELISKIDPGAKKTDPGFVSWKKIPAGREVKIAYNAFKDYAEGEGYYVLVRKDAVKEVKGTTEREFRFSSVIRPYGGVVPQAHPSGGTFAIAQGEEQEVYVNFEEEAGMKLFTSVNGADFAETGSSITFTATAGTTVTISAYLVDEKTGEESETVTYTYRYITDGELDDYKDAWGYNYFKSVDQKEKGDNYKLLYQRVYLAYATYNPAVDISDLKLDTEMMKEVISCINDDNPGLIQIDGRYRYNSTSIMLEIREKNLCDTLYAQCEASLEEIKANITEKYGSLDEATRLQKVKEIHDYLILKKEYKDSAMSQTMAGSLSEAYTPVCMSYTLAMKWCCDKLGIQCLIVYGKARNENHAWNIINYGEPADYSDPETVYNPGEWYEMDVTWDDPTNMPEEYIGYSYFNLTTDQMNESRTRRMRKLPYTPFEKCTGTAYSYDNCEKNGLFD